MAGTGRKATKKQRVTAIENLTKVKPPATRENAAAGTARKTTGTSRKKTTTTAPREKTAPTPREKTGASRRKYPRKAGEQVATELREM